MEWQPIETAPKDGTEILLFGSLESSPKAMPHIGMEMIYFGFFDKKSGAFYSEIFDAWFPKPSHWMPLPNPPVQS